MLEVYKHTAPFELEGGESLPGFELAYTTAGTLNREGNNVVWICHALTGNAQPEEWWPGLVGSGKLLDPDRYFIVCANVLGGCYGSTGPLSINPQTGEPWYHSFPVLTNRDIVRAFQLLKEHIGISRINVMLGGSLGGQHAVEWAISSPKDIERLVLLATNAWHSPWGIAFNESQRMAIEADSSWLQKSPKAGEGGLKVARSIGMLSYRTWQIYNERQAEAATSADKLENYRAATYQQYQGQKLVNRFNAFTYYRLSQAMDSHQVGRGRGSAAAALAGVSAKTLVVGVDSDILFPVHEQEFLAAHIPAAALQVISSVYGHDGFLVEAEAIAAAIQGHFPELRETAVTREKIGL
ncbi:homoserine O-acetyltransferase [Cesiribacter sp. SM1]|uniref:homoserine O-acetyltransferase family protein n=1 Tax=Cesiribacter sp. SM1 TaxID=2861196 RepID=UPI001CD264E7|nr:homoserine O-acetyltransferase [Cesiribacter sp. SM1]